MEDKLKIYNAEICLHCDEVKERNRGGIRPYLCGKCADKLKLEYKEMNRNGIYLTPQPKE